MAFRTNKTPVLQEKSASGSVASFNTALAMPLVNGEFTIQAYQEGSGDPSPVNKRNIIPFSELNMYKRGVNLWDEQWELGGYYNDTGLPRPLTDRIRCKNAIPIKQDTEIYTPFSMAFLFYDKNDNVLPSVSRVGYSRADNMYLRQSSNTEGKFLIPQGAYYMRFYLQNTYGTTYNNDISINYPSTDTDYHAYNGAQYTKQLGEEIFGGSYNSVTGDKRKTVNSKWYNGSENWTETTISGYKYFQYRRGEIPSGANFISNMIKKVGATSSNYVGYVGGSFLNVRFTEETTLEEFKSILSNDNLQIVYDMAEPIEIQILPTPINTFIGNNTIFCDTGDVDLTFKDLDIAKRGNFREVFKLPS